MMGNNAENPESSARNPEDAGAALNGSLELGTENVQEMVEAAVPRSPGSQLETSNPSAEVRPADPFFSGRKHFPELDGLRGLAICLVLICHFCAYLPASSAAGADILAVASFG